MAIRSIATYTGLVWDSLVEMLGLDPDAEETQSAVRSTWIQPGQPGFLITDDIVFFRIMTGGDQYDQKVYLEHGAVDSVAHYTRVITLILTAYGPSAPDNLERIRTCFIAGFGTLNLKAQNIFPVINPGSVIRAPELFEGQFWERADFSIIMYAKEDTSVAIPGIEQAEITIIADDDERRTIEWQTSP